MQALQINEKLKALVQTERKVIAEILKLIQILDITKSYRELGFSSLFNYLTAGLGYSEGAAQRRISSARLIKEVPSIGNDLQSGALNLTQVSMAHTAIAQQEKAGDKINTADKYKILESLKHKNSFATKQELQKQLPDYDPTPKSLTFPKNESVQVMLSFTQEQWQEVRGFLARNSHKVPDQKIESLLLKVARADKAKDTKSLLKIQNMQKVQSSKQAKKPGNHLPEASVNIHAQDNSEMKNKKSPPHRKWTARKSIPENIRRYVFWRAQGKCQFVSPITNKPCESQHFVQTEHEIPIAHGGSNDIENLRLYCREHNALAAKLSHLT